MKKGFQYAMSFLFTIGFIPELMAQGSWVPEANFTGTPKTLPGSFALDFTGDGIPDKGYLFSGRLTAGNNFNDLWQYDPVTNSWAQMASVPGTNIMHGNTVVLNNIAYTFFPSTGIGAAGDFLSNVWAYDTTNTWTAKNDFPGPGRWGATAFALNGYIYAASGDEGPISAPDFVNEVWQYDPIKDDWTQKNNFPGAANVSSGGFSIDTNGDGIPDKGFMICGTNNSTVYNNQVWEYDPVADSWTQKSNLPGSPRNTVANVAFGSVGYAGTGNDTSGNPLSDMYQYNYQQDTWQAIADVPSPRYGPYNFILNGTLFLGGGSNSGGILFDLYKYALPAKYDTVTATICEGQFYDGRDSTGTYIDTFVVVGGDSVRILHLTVFTAVHISESVTICQGQSHNGYTQTGYYADTFAMATGCDSIYDLDLTVLPAAINDVSQTVCAGQSYGGHDLSGTYIDTFTAYNGCDSISTLHLTVLPHIIDTVNQSICLGQSYDGYSSTGSYRDTFTSVNGCDSVRVLNLTATTPVETNVLLTLCGGASYDGYDQTGIYVDTFRAQGGCDSIRTLDLFINPIEKSTASQTICAGQNYEGYTTQGTYVDTFPTISGCDSIRTLDLTVLPYNNNVTKQQICQGQIFEGHTTSGTYIDTFIGANGCDSLVTLELNVNAEPFIPTILQVGDTLIAISGYQYQWYQNNTLLTGDTGSNLLITEGAYYMLQITDSGGCNSQSAIFYAYPTGIATTDAEESISIYPNPNNGRFSISFDQPIAGEVDLTLADIDGRILWNLSLQNITPGNIEAEPVQISTGIYIFTIRAAGIYLNKKLVVE